MPKRVGRARRRTPQPRRASRAGTTALQLAGELTPDTPQHLAQVVPHLAPEMLHQLIRQRGLDVCGEIIALATPAQLTSVFDIDLWRSAQPGRDDRFDTERFGEWLEILVDAGGTVAARIVAAMDEHLVVAGLSRYVRVFDPATLATTVDGEPLDIDVTSHQGPECELGGYLVRGLTADSWDAIIALLLALDTDHHDRFHAVMRECRRLSNSTPEVDGLDSLLMEPEQLLHDVALDREHRRETQGYSTPADARAFLLMARRRRRQEANSEPSVNPRRALGPPTTPATRERPRAVPERIPSEPSPLARIHVLIAYVRDSNDTLFLARSHELAFLANTLVAGCSIQGRAFSPQEAADAAISICNLGLEHWPARRPEPLADSFLMDHDLVSAFEVGWAVLYEDVGMFAAGQLLFALSDLHCIDADIQEGLDALQVELTTQRDAGTPWRARDALDVIGMLDMPAWAGVMGLLDECPVMPAALTATLDGQTGAVSATEFEHISTRSQLGRVREFMARLPDILRR